MGRITTMNLNATFLMSLVMCWMTPAFADVQKGETTVQDRGANVVIDIQGDAGAALFQLLAKEDKNLSMQREVKNNHTHERIFCSHSKNNTQCSFYDMNDGSRVGRLMHSLTGNAALATFEDLPLFDTTWMYGELKVASGAVGSKIHCTWLQRRIDGKSEKPMYHCRTALWPNGIFGPIEPNIIGVIN